MPLPKLERHVEKTVCIWADARGIKHTKLNGFGQRGKPDRVFWIRGGRPALIEFKRPGEEPSRLQRYHLEEFKALGYQVSVVERADEGVAWLESLMKKGKRK